MQVKKCYKCGEYKPVTLQYFHKDSSRKTGFDSRCKTCRKDYLEANKEYIAERSKSYRMANLENILKYEKSYNRTPKGKYVNMKGAAKWRGIHFSLPFDLYESKMWGEPCHYCGVEIEVTGLDRKDNNKGYIPGNVVPCCWDCNKKKGTKLYEDFLQEIKTNTCNT